MNTEASEPDAEGGPDHYDVDGEPLIGAIRLQEQQTNNSAHSFTRKFVDKKGAVRAVSLIVDPEDGVVDLRDSTLSNFSDSTIRVIFTAMGMRAISTTFIVQGPGWLRQYWRRDLELQELVTLFMFGGPDGSLITLYYAYDDTARGGGGDLDF